MKKAITLLSFLIFIFYDFAQYTAIPDINFENALAAYDDIPGDGQVPTANFAVVTSLTVSNLNISDLTGIEDFTNLEEFWCINNQSSSLDVSQNPTLINISCSYNPISNIDVSQNPLLEYLSVRGTQLTSLDITNN